MNNLCFVIVFSIATKHLQRKPCIIIHPKANVDIIKISGVKKNGLNPHVSIFNTANYAASFILKANIHIIKISGVKKKALNPHLSIFNTPNNAASFNQKAKIEG